MTHRMIRFGHVHEESQDKGPFKLGKVLADGKVMDVEFADLTGSEGSPLKGSRVIIMAADDDDGKAVAFVYGPPVKDRTDGQKPGEVTYKNHKTGAKVVLDKDGNRATEVPGKVTEKSGGDYVETVGGNKRITTKGLLLINC